MHKPPKFDHSEKIEKMPPKHLIKENQGFNPASQNSPGRDVQKSQNSPGREEHTDDVEKIDVKHSHISSFFKQQETSEIVVTWKKYHLQFQERIQVLIEDINDKLVAQKKKKTINAPKIVEYKNCLDGLDKLKNLYLEKPSEKVQFKAIQNAHKALCIAVYLGCKKLVKLLIKMEAPVFSVGNQLAFGFISVQKPKVLNPEDVEENVLFIAIENKNSKIFELVFEKAKTELKSLQVKPKRKCELWQLLLAKQPTEEIRALLEAVIADAKPTSCCSPH